MAGGGIEICTPCFIKFLPCVELLPGTGSEAFKCYKALVINGGDDDIVTVGAICLQAIPVKSRGCLGRIGEPDHSAGDCGLDKDFGMLGCKQALVIIQSFDMYPVYWTLSLN